MVHFYVWPESQLSLILKEYLAESHLEHKADSDAVICSTRTQELD